MTLTPSFVLLPTEHRRDEITSRVEYEEQAHLPRPEGRRTETSVLSAQWPGSYWMEQSGSGALLHTVLLRRFLARNPRIQCVIRETVGPA